MFDAKGMVIEGENYKVINSSSFTPAGLSIMVAASRRSSLPSDVARYSDCGINSKINPMESRIDWKEEDVCK
ncbi:hypothetical protein IEQ34_017500 [Dendrobium chrysotoxum]|uniref:Uncharacterized protein n=1 Tax=Dendrobium chrysotoxum TaxID=161865 RepID=A0AAV7G9T2_DENCH|nr:hypothetical protein IEQ34_017500 [Dendrobium chrysotoxum]